jgi:hypothetical protein
MARKGRGDVESDRASMDDGRALEMGSVMSALTVEAHPLGTRGAQSP